MTTAMQYIVDNMRTELFDPAPGSGWSDDELVAYLNEGVQATCAAKPDVAVQSVDVTLAAGTDQPLPADAIQLFDILYNVVSGKVITQVDKAMLESADPNWKARTPTTDIEHYEIDQRKPRRFTVYPPSNGASSVRMQYGAIPGLVVIGDNFPLADIYVPAVVSYAMAKAFGKPSQRVGASIEKVSMYRQQWAQLIGLKTQVQATNTARVSQGNPT
jgi:hypothetical protein